MVDKVFYGFYIYNRDKYPSQVEYNDHKKVLDLLKEPILSEIIVQQERKGNQPKAAEIADWRHKAAEIADWRHKAAEIADWRHKAAEIADWRHKAATIMKREMDRILYELRGNKYSVCAPQKLSFLDSGMNYIEAEI
jgi:hypothetical protein